jgi:hypothetical protein
MSLRAQELDANACSLTPWAVLRPRGKLCAFCASTGAKLKQNGANCGMGFPVFSCF